MAESRDHMNGAIWLKREGEATVVCIEHKGQWVELIRESGAVFSHICEPAGIQSRIKAHEFSSDGAANAD